LHESGQKTDRDCIGERNQKLDVAPAACSDVNLAIAVGANAIDVRVNGVGEVESLLRRHPKRALSPLESRRHHGKVVTVPTRREVGDKAQRGN